MKKKKLSPDVFSKIKDIYEFMVKENISELDWEHGNTKILLKRFERKSESVHANYVINDISEEKTRAENNHCIRSPISGIFYAAPSPGSSPYVEVGNLVEKGQTICIVEAMKMMNEIQAEKKCKILKVLVSDRDHVKQGQELFEITHL